MLDAEPIVLALSRRREGYHLGSMQKTIFENADAEEATRLFATPGSNLEKRFRFHVSTSDLHR